MGRNMVLCLLLVCTIGSIQAQSESVDGPYVIVSAKFLPIGSTLPYYLEKAADIQIGKKFPDKAALDAYIADRTQILLNQRVLKSAEIEVVIGEAGPEGIRVDLIVRTVDTWNIVVLPYFKYDSNDGLLLSVRGRDYNFFGTMLPLRVNLNYEQDLSDDISWGGDADFSLPFKLFDRDWSFDTKQSITFAPDSPTSYGASAGVFMDQPVSGTTLRFGLVQGLEINERNSDDTYHAGIWYLWTKGSVSWSIPTPVDLGTYGIVRYTPSAFVKHNYKPDGYLGLDRHGPTLEVSHSLSFGRVDWLDNFRRGLQASLSNTNSYNVHSASWSRSVSFSASWFDTFEWFALCGRVKGFWNFDSADTSAGDDIRGVLNARVSADAAVFFNLDVPVWIVNFKPSQWWGWWDLFDFEQHWAPFFDACVAFNKGHSVTYDSFWYSGGLELITFPSKMRSFYIRISAGWDLRDVLETRSLSGRSERDGKSIRELSIGLGHFY